MARVFLASLCIRFDARNSAVGQWNSAPRVIAGREIYAPGIISLLRRLSTKLCIVLTINVRGVGHLSNLTDLLARLVRVGLSHYRRGRWQFSQIMLNSPGVVIHDSRIKFNLSSGSLAKLCNVIIYVSSLASCGSPADRNNWILGGAISRMPTTFAFSEPQPRTSTMWGGNMHWSIQLLPLRRASNANDEKGISSLESIFKSIFNR